MKINHFFKYCEFTPSYQGLCLWGPNLGFYELVQFNRMLSREYRGVCLTQAFSLQKYTEMGKESLLVLP